MTREERFGYIIAVFFHTVIILLFVVLAPGREIPDSRSLDLMIIREQAEAVAAMLPKSPELRRKEAVLGVHEKPSKLLSTPQGAMEQKNEQHTPAMALQSDEQRERSPVRETESAVANVAQVAQATAGHQEATVTTATRPVAIAHPAVSGAAGFGSSPGAQFGSDSQGKQLGEGVSSVQTNTGRGGGAGEAELGTAGAPAFVYREIPAYPLLARRMGKEGKAVLRLFISERGEVFRIEVVEDTGYGFAEAAKEAVKKSSFSAARRNGVAVTARALLTVRFALKSE